MDVVDWQDKLSKHFRELSCSRAANGWPVFVLEHALPESQLGQLQDWVRKSIIEDASCESAWLPWVVYATEIGYHYSGEEFWQTFEKETPGWVEHGDRNWIRKAFQLFRNTYSGAAPSGAWAENFTIICWPITNAILPRDLQVQLASVLFDVRFSLTAEMFKSPELLGELIEGRSLNATSRFRNFLQERLFVGQLATALLLDSNKESSPRIQRVTLQRIVSDLEKESRARAWLHGASQHARKISLSGLAPSVSRPSLGSSERDAQHNAECFGVAPRILLRPMRKMLWDVMVEIPSFSHLLQIPEIGEILKTKCCRVAGSDNRPLARGRILLQDQKMRLQKWPSGHEPLLDFDGAPKYFCNLFATNIMLGEGPLWLFRLGDDGWGKEIKSKLVRPGGRYVVLSSEDLTDSSKLFSRIEVGCNGIKGMLLSIPENLQNEDLAFVRKLGLDCSTTFRMWPVGMPPKYWDGEGYAEWAAPDSPYIGISANTSIDDAVLQLDGRLDSELHLGNRAAGEIVFICLDDLAPGPHQIKAKVECKDGSSSSGVLDIQIRDAVHWYRGSIANMAVSVIVDPPNPTLEALWDGNMRIDVLGPPGRKIDIIVDLFEKSKQEAFFSLNLEELHLSIDTTIWATTFAEKVQKPIGDRYDIVTSCRIRFKSDELGEYTLVCEREFCPLRWVPRRARNVRTVKLIDDNALPESADLRFYSIDRPDIYETLVYAESISGIKVPREGGLYYALFGRNGAAILVPPIIMRLDDFTCDPRIKDYSPSQDDICKLINIITIWGKAKGSGGFCWHFRSKVMERFQSALTNLIAGEKWLQLEKSVMENKGLTLSTLSAGVSAQFYEREVGKLLLDQRLQNLNRTPPEQVLVIESLAKRFSLLPKRMMEANCRTICEFALRLASAPQTVTGWLRAVAIEDAITCLLENPVLYRACRFLVLSTQGGSNSTMSCFTLNPKWEWE